MLANFYILRFQNNMKRAGYKIISVVKLCTEVLPSKKGRLSVIT